MADHETEVKKEDMIQIALPDGRMVGAIEVDYEFENEPWTTVRMADGTVLKLRVQINKVFRTDQYDPINGEPMYFIQNGLQIKTQVPANLKKKPRSSRSSGQEIA